MRRRISPLSIKVLCSTARPGAPVTLAGDTAQRLYLDAGFGDWDTLIKQIGIRASIFPLSVSYRSTRQVMELARLVLGDLAPDVRVRDARRCTGRAHSVSGARRNRGFLNRFFKELTNNATLMSRLSGAI